jgi:hypothetical protein
MRNIPKNCDMCGGKIGLQIRATQPISMEVANWGFSDKGSRLYIDPLAKENEYRAKFIENAEIIGYYCDECDMVIHLEPTEVIGVVNLES